MKKNSLSVGFSLLLVSISIAGVAQTQTKATLANPTPEWVSEKGFWMIESNIHTPKQNTVYFYNNDNLLVSKEKVDGVVLNLKKRKVKMQLKKRLEQVLAPYDQSTTGEMGSKKAQ